MGDVLQISNGAWYLEGVWGWLSIIGVSLVLTLIIKGLLNAVLGRVGRFTKNTDSQIDDILVETGLVTKGWAIFFWLVYAGFPLLKVHTSVEQGARTIVVLVTVLQILIWGMRALGYWRKCYLMKKVAEDASSAAAIGLMCTALQTLFIVTIVLIGLSNLGVDVAALVAGLGVGGIAVALAAQNILGDLLASLSIVLDKPFVVGDFIIVGSELGTVEHIGVKTTRVRSLSGEELVLSNKDLLESRIRNFKRMWQRRVVQKFGVIYSTPVEKLEQIPEWTKAFVEEDPKLKFDRCHFAAYGASSLDFELVYFVADADFNVHMDLQQQLLLKIFRKFAAEGVEFAFPTQTLYIERLPLPPAGGPNPLASQGLLTK